jgi:GTP-binding protein
VPSVPREKAPRQLDRTQPPQERTERAHFSTEEIEAGRRLFAADWHFAAAAADLAVLPPAQEIEIAFAGRSNVGKSRLINALTGRRTLARTSHTPGRTQQLVFFAGAGPLRLVDLPGYGYAAAPKSKASAWTALVNEYLGSRASLARVHVLIDARRGVVAADLPFLARLDQLGVSYQLVLTKIDLLRPHELEDVIAAAQRSVASRPAAFPEIAATSALTGSGIVEFRARIAWLVAERRGVREPREEQPRR